METRQITQVKVYILALNCMRHRIEQRTIIAVSYEKEKLISWYNSLRTEPYTTEGSPSFEVHGDSHKWRKFFKAGSELEWYNPCYDDFTVNSFGHGISEQWVTKEVAENFGQKIIY